MTKFIHLDPRPYSTEGIGQKGDWRGAKSRILYMLSLSCYLFVESETVILHEKFETH